MTGDSGHTGIAVEVRDKAGKVVGVLEVDYRAHTFGKGRDPGWSDHAEAFFGATRGSFAFAYRPVKGDHKLPGRVIKGSITQDNMLTNWLLAQMGESREWFDTVIGKGEMVVGERLAWGRFTFYGIVQMDHSCHGFTLYTLNRYAQRSRFKDGFGWTTGSAIIRITKEVIEWQKQDVPVLKCPSPFEIPDNARNVDPLYVPPARPDSRPPGSRYDTPW